MNLLKQCSNYYFLIKAEDDWDKILSKPIYMKHEDRRLFERSKKDPSAIQIQKSNIDYLVAKYKIPGKLVGKGNDGIVFSDGSIATKITGKRWDAFQNFKISKIKSQIDDDSAKHLPDIYDVEYNKETKLYIITMEALKPFNKSLQSIQNVLFDMPIVTTQDSLTKLLDRIILLRNKDFLMQLLDNLKEQSKHSNTFIDNIENIKYNTALKISTYFNSSEFEEAISNILNLSSFDKLKEFVNKVKSTFSKPISPLSKRQEDQIKNLIRDRLEELIKLSANDYIADMSAIEEVDYDINRINFKMVANDSRDFVQEASIHIWNHVYEGYTMPESVWPQQKNKINLSKNIPEAQSLLNIMKILKRDFNVNVSDIQDFNVMLRPGTNDIVIADLGKFI